MGKQSQGGLDLGELPTEHSAFLDAAKESLGLLSAKILMQNFTTFPMLKVVIGAALNPPALDAAFGQLTEPTDQLSLEALIVDETIFQDFL